jgi:hypothetical protein
MINKILAASGVYSKSIKKYSAMDSWDDEETSDEDKLRTLVLQPFIELHVRLQDVLVTNKFARDNVSDAEFAAVVYKKIVKDLRAAADVFEHQTKHKEE